MKKGILERLFRLEQHGSTVKAEILAGFTTFLTLAYIIFVNPAILSSTGMDKGAVFTATCLIGAGGTLMMALIANSPIALAPGMALNSFFAFVVVGIYGYDWQNALGMSFIAGIIFVILTLTNVRVLLIKSLPDCLYISIITGISLLIALIALKTNNIILVNQNVFMELGNLATWENGLFALGFLFIVMLDYFKVQGAILVGIITMTAIHLLKSYISWKGFFSLPPSVSANAMKIQFSQLEMHGNAIKAISSFILIALFDATGTLVGLLRQPALRHLPNNDKKIERSLLADGIAAACTPLIGSSSTSAFIESATGIQSGGRTGLTALVVSVLFLVSLFFSPLVALVPSFAVGSALMYISCCIMKDVVRLDTKDITNFAPAVLTMLMIPFSFSIADGIGVGVISYTLLKLLSKQYHLLNKTLITLTVVFLVYFLFLH